MEKELTFFVGNGFDISYGMKSSTKEFLKWYIEQTPNNKLVISIKEDIDLWSNLELMIGKHAVEYEEPEQYLENITLLVNALNEYLSDQERILDLDYNKLASDFIGKINSLGDYLGLKERKRIDDWKLNIFNGIQYNIVSFNYTFLLARIVEEANKIQGELKHKAGTSLFNDKLNKVFHIHGTLEEDMILGVDSPEQINNKKFSNSEEILTSIVKHSTNVLLGEEREEFLRSIINKSQYIVIIGMSIGETDKRYWQMLYAWLKMDPSKRIIVFWFEDTPTHNTSIDNNRRTRKVISRFFSMTNATAVEISKIKSQIIVPKKICL